MKIKKQIALLLTGLLTLLNVITPVLAANQIEPLSSEAILTQSTAIFDVTVPTTLPITVDSNNNAIVSTDAKVINNSIGPIVIAGISKTEKNGWVLTEAPFEKIGKKELKFDITVNNPKIAAKSSTGIVYTAKTSPQKSLILNEAVLDVVFTVDWDQVNHSEIVAVKDKIAINEQTKLSVPVAEGETILWKNSNPSVAKIIAKTRSANPSEIVAGGEVEIKALNIGTTTITAVDGNGNTFTREIVVVENSLQSIYIATQPTKLIYKAGEVFDPTGMVLKAIYLNGDEYELPMYSYSKAPLIEGQQTVELLYTEKGISKTVDVMITVSKVKRQITIQSSLGGTASIDKTEATEGETVKITVTPNAGYMVDSIKVNNIVVENLSFTVADKDVAVSVTFKVITAPVIGTKFEDATYEYAYGQAYYNNGVATNVPNQTGWGVKLKDKNLSGKIPAPLIEIRGYPVVNFSYMFYGSKATTLDLSNFDTSKVTDMYAMFYRSAATIIDLSSFNTSNVTNMSAMFESSAVTILDLSNFNTSKVINMYYMFYESAATTLDLSSFDISNVTNMGSMFYNSAATTGYARTAAEAARFNLASTMKPARLTFVVK